MKIFHTIKQNIYSFFNKIKIEPILPIMTEIEKTNGPTNIDIHNIHSIFSDIQKKISNEELDILLKSILSTENIFKFEKKRILLDIFGDCLTLHGNLIPLINLGITYSIDVVGGSVRDFLLNKHKEIKDLDILIRLTNPPITIDYRQDEIINSNQLVTEKILKKEWCTKEELENVNFSDGDPLYRKHNKLLQLCLNRNHQLTSTNIFSKNERLTGDVIYGEDILINLSGIIKVESDKLKYPMEILLTDKVRESFLQGVDFGLCNVGLKIIELKDDTLKLTTFEEIPKNFFASIGFFEDIKNKTITYNTYNSSTDQLEYSLINHFKRVSAKYPEYKFQLSENAINEDTKKNINSILLADQLTTTLNIEEKPVQVKRKNKI